MNSPMFWLARMLGEKHISYDTGDGVQTTLLGYRWRGTFYVWSVKQKVYDREKHKQALGLC